MTMRVALYARYSTDKQNDRSVEAQFADCEAYAAQRGWTVATRFEDRGRTGTTLFQRPGVHALVDAVKAGGIDVVLCEQLSRLSRDQEDGAWLYKRVVYAGAKIWTLSQGEVDKWRLGIESAKSASEIDDIADRTRRGLRDRVRSGCSGGGISYGYAKVVPAEGDVVGKRGHRAVDPAQAEVVRGIFRDYAAGVGPAAIVEALNSAGTPGPRGSQWRVTTLLGQKANGTGVLRNRLYIGELVWGRRTFKRDPDSGGRRGRKAEREPEIALVPDLRIVDDAAWAAVQARLAEAHRSPLSYSRRPTHLLSGLLFCGCCGGPYTIEGYDKLACATRREQRTCDNGRRVLRIEVEQRFLDAVATKLAHPDLISAYVREYHDAFRRETQAAQSAALDLHKRKAELERRQARLLAAIEGGNAEGPAGRAIMAQLNDTAGQLEAVSAELAKADAEAPVYALHPNLGERLARQVRDLRAALEGSGADMARAREILRGLVDRIVISPDLGAPADGRGGGPVIVTLEGQMARMLDLSNSGPSSKNPFAGDCWVRGQDLNL